MTLKTTKRPPVAMTPAALRVYLEQHRDDAFSRPELTRCEDCPVARFLQDSGIAYAIVGISAYSWPATRDPLSKDRLETALPSWASSLIREIDRTDKRPIRGVDVLDLMDRITGVRP